MKKVELLAPAGSMESLYAAVNSGADAVYLGGSKFSARAYASNFDEEKMKEIVKVHYGDIEKKLLDNTMKAFYEIRKMNDLQKKPGTSELLDWLQALMISGVTVEKIQDQMPFIGVLLKKNQDIDIFNEIKEKGYSLKRW